VGFALLAVRSGLAARPADLGWGALAGGGMLAGIGFTMALFIADLAFQGVLLQAAKLGILAASLASAAGGLALLVWLARGHPHRPQSQGGAGTR
jgi:NhaA family Na+:H+ antiporter